MPSLSKCKTEMGIRDMAEYILLPSLPSFVSGTVLLLGETFIKWQEIEDSFHFFLFMHRELLGRIHRYQ